MRCHLTTEWPSSESPQITNAREDVEKRNLLTLSAGMEFGAATMESSVEVP